MVGQLNCCEGNVAVTSGNEILITILLSNAILMGIVGMIASSISLLKKGKQYNKHLRRLMIAMLVIALVFSLYMLYMAFAISNPHPSASPVPLH